MGKKSLPELREEIDGIDEQLLELLNKRMEVVQSVGKLKRDEGTVVYRPEREKSIIKNLNLLNKGLLSKAALEAIFQEIFAVSRNFELAERVAYLGPEGSFTHQAAESKFGTLSEYVSLRTIEAIFDSVETDRARFGVVPIENNQEGSVNETIDLLCQKEVKIVAEFPMAIHFTFASLEDSVKKINTIYSKDIAFRQCDRFIRDFFPEDIKKVAVTSTSKAARLALENKNTAAICSHIAAKLYDTPILFDNIEDSKNNRTRFLVISKNIVNKKSGDDKTSILAKVSNKPGSLMELIKAFKDRKINLTKLESRPAKIKDTFQYWFLIDFDGHIEDEKVKEILDQYRNQILHLGSYPKLY